MATQEENAAIAIEMQQHIAAQQTSDLSIRQYCKDNGLRIHRFNYWLYNSKRGDASGKDMGGFSLVHPSVTAGPSAGAAIEVTQRYPVIGNLQCTSFM